MKKTLLLFFLAGSAILHAQSLQIDFGSTFASVDPFPALRFADPEGIRFDTSLSGGNTGIITVGHFDDIEAQTTFAEYLADFTQIGNESPFIADREGYLQTATSTTIAPGNRKPYAFVLGGVTSFADAAAATSFSIYSHSGWANFPASLDNFTQTLDLLALEPDGIVAGRLIEVPDGFDLVAISTAVPEPSTYALMAGLLSLGYLIIRRSPASSAR